MMAPTSAKNKYETIKAYPVLQVPKARLPSTQAGAAFGKGVAVAQHAPQLATSVLRFTSQPLSICLSQSANLQGQEDTCVMHRLI
jgi:hypothetical protein